MAAAFIPKFGGGAEEYCAGECRHTDCAAMRSLVSTPCTACGTPIGDGLGRYYSERVQITHDSAGRPQAPRYIHAECLPE